jgi:hypothetical protein
MAFLLASCIASAQDNPAPAPAAAETPAAQPQTEMQKWIAATDAQWQAAYQRDVTDVHEAEAKKLMLQYLNLLEEAIVKASKASDLDGAVALRTEQKRFGDTQLFPEQDEAADPAAVKQVRAAIRAQLAKLKADSAARAKALHAKYDQVLAQAQTQLTQRQRIDDALLVKAKRAEVAAAWITPAAAGDVPNPAAGQPAKVATPAPKIPFGQAAASSTGREHISALVGDHGGPPVKLRKNGSISTKASFTPPVDITIEAKTDSTNIRLAYAADQVIFNWEVNSDELRVDGGPAARMHKMGAGRIPVNKYVTIRWLVTPTKQTLYVDGEQRFEHAGDYSKLDRPLKISSAVGSEVTVKSIKVKQLPAGTE